MKKTFKDHQIKSRQHLSFNTEFKDDFLKPLGKVENIKNKREFTLSPQEIKHVRRCLRLYSNIHDRDYDDQGDENNLSHIVYNKFLKAFGKISDKRRRYNKAEIMKGMKRICSFEGCQEKDNLTLHHQISLASGENRNNKENFRFLCPKHHLLIELNNILWQKGLETKRLMRRIEDIEKKDTTDCLGYKVISKDKFIDLENESREVKNGCNDIT